MLPSWIWLRLRETLSIKLLLVRGNAENTLKSGLLILMPLDWSFLNSFCILLIYLCLFFIWSNQLGTNEYYSMYLWIGRCVGCRGVCMSVCLFRCWVGEGGTWVVFFSCVVCGLELGFVWKNALWFETSFSIVIHSAL